ncbi:MAG: RIP metalloprotease RseP [Chitinophagaceae bacterium]|jgi:regulator of sigma E protease|nr:RIP metalloprotease RseP [Chitinophagaceae bacterium]
MTLLAIDWGSVGIKAAQFILSISILVVFHEFGHFITAKLFKCRVEKFYLFFDPWFSLFKKKKGETEYGIGWVPLGGYVKISGMIDESMDKAQMKEPPKPYEFRSKPAWQRLIIMVSGVVVNVLLAFVIYAMMLWHWGDSYLPTKNLKYGIATDSLGKSIGLQNGDKIMSVDGKEVERFNNVSLKIILDNAKSIEVERDGQTKSIAIPDDFAQNLIHFKDVDFIVPRLFNVISKVADTSVAQKAGLKDGDKIVEANGTPIQFYDQFKEVIQANKNKPLTIKVLRGNDTVAINLTVPKAGMIGIATQIPDSVYQFTKLQYGFLESLPAGLNKSKETLRSYVLQLKLIFSGKVKASESVGSVISIGNLFPGQWDWESFWKLTAFISLILAFMNILPIPALDGGHALFCIIEMITGRKPSDKFMERAQMIGMVLLLSLMAYALGLDVFRLFKKG